MTSKASTPPPTAILPAKDVLMMVLTLPSSDVSELDGMISLQAEELSPYPPERTSHSWELLASAGNHSQVLLVLCALQKLDQLHEQCASQQLPLPRRVDVDLLGGLELLAAKGLLPEEASTLLLIAQDSTVYVVAWHENQPVLFRTLGEVQDLTAVVVTEELEMACLSLESAHPESEYRDLQLWHDGEAPNWATVPLGEWTPELHSLADLPPFETGVQLRSEKNCRLDLAPQSWKREEARKQNRRKLMRTASIGLGIWAVFMLGILIWGEIHRQSTRNLQRQNQEKAPAVDQVQALTDQVRSLSQFTNRSSSALETMLILAEATPGSGTLVVDDFQYRKEEGISFSGKTAGNVQPFYQFLENLAGDERLRVGSYNLRETREGFSFTVDARWEWLALHREDDS